MLRSRSRSGSYRWGSASRPGRRPPGPRAERRGWWGRRGRGRRWTATRDRPFWRSWHHRYLDAFAAGGGLYRFGGIFEWETVGHHVGDVDAAGFYDSEGDLVVRAARAGHARDL